MVAVETYFKGSDLPIISLPFLIFWKPFDTMHVYWFFSDNITINILCERSLEIMYNTRHNNRIWHCLDYNMSAITREKINGLSDLTGTFFSQTPKGTKLSQTQLSPLIMEINLKGQ